MNPRPNRSPAFANGTHPTEGGVSWTEETLASITEIDSRSDEQLIELLKEGSSDAFARLFRRYRQLVFSIGVKILRDEAEAEDVVQEVFIEVCKKATLFDATRGSFKIWILQYAYSRSLDRHRYLTIRRGDHISESRNGNNHKKLEPCYVPDSLERLTFEERLIKITNALKDLPTKHRQVVELIYFEGLEITEVADRLRETEGNVRNCYYRGVKRLREILTDTPVGNGRL